MMQDMKKHHVIRLDVVGKGTNRHVTINSNILASKTFPPIAKANGGNFFIDKVYIKYILYL